MKPITFTRWIATFRTQNSPFGDLANDIAADPTWPERGAAASHLCVLILHLYRLGASRAALDTMYTALLAYRRHVVMMPPAPDYKDIQRLDAYADAYELIEAADEVL